MRKVFKCSPCKPIFSPEDKDLEKWKWQSDSNGYARVMRRKGGRPYNIYAHHLVMERALGPKPEGLCRDHINRIPMDNRRENLRYVTYRENNLNSSHRKNNFLYATVHKTGKFQAAYKNKYLGLFNTSEEATGASLRYKQQLETK